MSQVAWQAYKEPLWVTLARTGGIAAAVGGILAWRFGGGLARWPMAALLVFWISFGGHWVEVFFLNFLRPRLPCSRGVQVLARMVVWFAGGSILTAGMLATAMFAGIHPARWLEWWMPGVGFIAVELLAHVGMQLLGRPNFYNGRG